MIIGGIYTFNRIEGERKSKSGWKPHKFNPSAYRSLEDCVMYICLECIKTFDEPKRFEERHGLDTPPYEVTYGCPYCGGAFQDAIRCDCCGEVITDSYVEIDEGGKRYCDCCFIMRNILD